MSCFFAVLLLLLNAVVCQAAPTNDNNSSREIQNSEINPPAQLPTTESAPLLPQPTRQTSQSPPEVPPQPTPQTSQSPPEVPPQPTPEISQSPSEVPPQPTPQISQSPSEVPPCPPECQLQPSDPKPQEQQPETKTGWTNGLINLVKTCFKTILYNFTDLVVVTGEKRPRKPRKFIISFDKRRKQRVLKHRTDGNESDQEDVQAGNVSCFWYKDNRTPAPRTRVASCNGDKRNCTCKFCCVGEKLIDCRNCLTINCNPNISCCSCNINITVVNTVEI